MKVFAIGGINIIGKFISYPRIFKIIKIANLLRRFAFKDFRRGLLVSYLSRQFYIICYKL